MLVPPITQMLSEDVVKESQKVRSMYEEENSISWMDGRISALDGDIRTGVGIDSSPTLS